MSADNFNLVRRTPDGQWEVFLNLSASGEADPQLRRIADAKFATEAAAIEWAEAQGDTEYGTKVDRDSDAITATARGSTGDPIAKAWDAVASVDSPEAEALRSVFGSAAFRVLDNAIARESSRDIDVAEAIITRLAIAYLHAKGVDSH